MFPGKPCYFLKQEKCSIYSDRPKDPCQVFNCTWLEDETLPDWLKPNISNVIIAKKIPEHDATLTYYQVTEAGQKIDSTVLNWIMQWAVSTNKNIIYTVDGQMFMLGTKEFTQAVAQLSK